MYKLPPKTFTTMCDFRSHTLTAISTQTLRWLKNSAITGNAKILSNELGDPKGYIAWAEINRESLNQLAYTGRFPRYIYEWDEGYIRLILDVAIEPSSSKSAVRELQSLLREWKIIAYYRNGLRVYTRRNGRHVRVL